MLPEHYVTPDHFRNVVAADVDSRITARTCVFPPRISNLSLAFRSFICVHLSDYHWRRTHASGATLASLSSVLINTDRLQITNSVSRQGTMKRLINDSYYILINHYKSNVKFKWRFLWIDSQSDKFCLWVFFIRFRNLIQLQNISLPFCSMFITIN